MGLGTLATLTLMFIIATVFFTACEGRLASPVADPSVPPEPTIAEDSDGTLEPVSPATAIHTATPTPASTPVFVPTFTSTAVPPPPTLQQARGVQRHISPRSDHFSWVQRPLISNGRLSFTAKIDDGYEADHSHTGLQEAQCYDRLRWRRLRVHRASQWTRVAMVHQPQPICSQYLPVH